MDSKIIFLLVLQIVKVVCTDDPHSISSCISITKTPNINVYGNYNITVRYPTVNVTCINNATLIGTSHVTCNKDGTWSPRLPTCLVNCQAIRDPPVILSGVSLDRVKTDNKDRYDGTTISLSCVTPGYIVDGLSRITCNSKGQWVPKIPKCKPKTPPPPQKKWITILAITGPSALVVVVLILVVGRFLYAKRQRKHEQNEAIELSEKTNSKSFYKLWTIGRKHKKLLQAFDLRSLKSKASSIFGIKEAIRFVLEEDGTEVNSSAGMALCQDKVFIVLTQQIEWKPASHFELDKFKLTYDVCSCDRSERKLFLSSSLEDLLRQVEDAFRYRAHFLCLEEDGTTIEDTPTLVGVAGQLLMAIKDQEDWRPYSPADGNKCILKQLKPSEDRRNCFKVWTEDQITKKIIFADDLVDLHIKAAKAFSMSPPIEIMVLDDNVAIIDNRQLQHHRNDVLVATGSHAAYNSICPTDYSSNYGDMMNYYSELPDVLRQSQGRFRNTSDTYF